uniref:Calcitonin receptor-like protein 1 n=1 Tax=Angiostrongylus cantonensis TaxID=6313 RepID=A0A0K0DA02_ANGCA
MLREQGISPVPEPEDGSLWCNATYDTVLCWPPTPANTSVVLPCPPLKGLDPTRNIVKSCDRYGRWAGKSEGVYENPWGWTNFTVCFKMDYENVKKCHWSGKWQGRTESDFTREHGWTNFTMCYTDEVIYIMNNLNSESLGIAQEVAKNARKLEFVGLGLSLVSLIVSIAIFSYFRRLRVFRNLLHLHLMIAILMVVIIRLVLYIDLIFTGTHGPHQNPSDGRTINTMPFVCEAMYSLLEYFKTVAFGWMFLEGLHLHNQLVLTVFNSEPRLTRYLLAGYGIPLLHTLVWLFVVMIKKGFKVERCLGSYYLEPEFWILDGPRMAELVVNLFFICNVIRVLWSKVRESHSTSELDKMKKSVKAALMLIPLLGIPNIMQTIPFAPTRDNITIFAIWTYLASFTYMYQGLMITIIYCFTNKEVNIVLKAFYDRYRLQHTSQHELRRGSRSVASHYQVRNGQMTAHCGDEIVNNNGYTTANERTPLKSQCDCNDEIR